jgi:hypothetical protein
MTSQLYKLIGLVISERWGKALASQLYEDQHGFVYNRVIIENLFKINDAGAQSCSTQSCLSQTSPAGGGVRFITFRASLQVA